VLDLIASYRGNADSVIDHQLSQSIAIDEDNSTFDLACVFKGLR